MQKLVTIAVIAFSLLGSPAWAERVLVEDAQLTAIRLFGRTFETQAALVQINKLPGDCQVLWLPTGNSQRPCLPVKHPGAAVGGISGCLQGAGVAAILRRVRAKHR